MGNGVSINWDEENSWRRFRGREAIMSLVIVFQVSKDLRTHSFHWLAIFPKLPRFSPQWLFSEVEFMAAKADHFPGIWPFHTLCFRDMAVYSDILVLTPQRNMCFKILPIFLAKVGKSPQLRVTLSIKSLSTHQTFTLPLHVMFLNPALVQRAWHFCDQKSVWPWASLFTFLRNRE